MAQMQLLLAQPRHILPQRWLKFGEVDNVGKEISNQLGLQMAEEETKPEEEKKEEPKAVEENKTEENKSEENKEPIKAPSDKPAENKLEQEKKQALSKLRGKSPENSLSKNPNQPQNFKGMKNMSPEAQEAFKG